MKKARRIISNIFFILSVVIVIYVSYIVIHSRTSGEEIYILGHKPYIIITGSMEPTIKVNGLVVIKQGGYEEIKEGDIIGFNAPGFTKTVCHRVVEITEEGFVTKGDNNNEKDMDIVTKKMYIGKVVFKANITAIIIQEVQTPMGIIRVLVVPIITIILIVVAIKILKRNKAESDYDNYAINEEKRKNKLDKKSKRSGKHAK